MCGGYIKKNRDKLPCLIWISISVDVPIVTFTKPHSWALLILPPASSMPCHRRRCSWDGNWPKEVENWWEMVFLDFSNINMSMRCTCTCPSVSLSLFLFFYTYVHILSYASLLKPHVSKGVVPSCEKFELHNVRNLIHSLTQNLECNDKAWILIKPKLKRIGFALG